MKKRLFTIALLSASIFSLNISCSDDFVDREFYQDVQQSPLTSVQEMQAFIRGVYSQMRASSYYGADFLAYGEVRSDITRGTAYAGYYRSLVNYNMLSTDTYATNSWNQMYKVIAQANIAINTDVAELTGSDIDRSKAVFSQGQAYALRAQGFFDLLRLYGQKYTGGNLGIVLPLKYDPTAKMPRATVAETEAQIEADFAKALELMENNTSTVTTATKKTELTPTSLKALMSRYYLYKKDYAKVIELTEAVINSGEFNVIPEGLVETSFSYTMNGSAPNSMFELAVGQPAALGSTSYAYRLSPRGYGSIQIKDNVLPTLYTANDVRKNLIDEDGYITGKYTDINGYDNVRVLRYEEVLLNAIEAQLIDGSQEKALQYYNEIVTNRGLEAKTSITMEDLKAERAKELLGEGFRQWDLLRWNDTSFKPADKSVNLLAFPVPRAEINIAGTLIVQNPGYEN